METSPNLFVWYFITTFGKGLIFLACIEISRAVELSKIPGQEINSSAGILASFFTQRSDSISNDANSGNNLNTSRHIFQLLFPLLSCERTSIRQAVVLSLGTMHWLSYHTFFADIQPYLKNSSDDMRMRAAASNTITDKKKNTTAPANPSQKKSDRLSMELTHLLSLVADFVDHDIYRKNEAYMSAVYAYTRDTLRFLSEPEINIEWDHQMLRYYFCKFLEKYYNHIVKSSSENESADRYFPLNIRLSLFKLCEGWCGHGNLAAATRDRESKMMVAILDQIKDIKERANAATAMV